MTTENPLESQEPVQITELDMLRERCKLMGIVYSNNAGVDALKKKIQEKLEETDTKATAIAASAPVPVNPLADVAAPKSGKPMTLRQYLVARDTKLIRLRITNMDPKKADLQGEFFTVSNEYLGDIRKYVPFGETTDNGYHVPYCIYEMLKTREFLQIRTSVHPVTKHITTKTRYVREFALEVLPELTAKEIAELAAEQNASGRLEDRD